MKIQLEVISQQLKSIRAELCNHGLGIPFSFYPIIRSILQELEDTLYRLYRTIEDVDSTNPKAKKKKGK